MTTLIHITKTTCSEKIIIYNLNKDQQQNRFDGGGPRGNMRSNPWNDRGHRDDFQNKRRRY